MFEKGVPYPGICSKRRNVQGLTEATGWTF